MMRLFDTRRLVVSLISIIFLCVNYFSYRGDEVVVLDVGQGDAILIKVDHRKILIDGGPDKTVLFKLGKYLLPWDKRMDLMLLTHPHADHVNGLDLVSRSYKVNRFVYSGVKFKNLAYDHLLTNSHFDDSLVLKQESEVGLGKCKLRLIPSPLVFHKDTDNINNTSIVVSMSCGSDREFLFMGDAEHEEEQALLDLHMLPRSFFLKAGHHCSKTSSYETFLRAVKPSIAVCSVGRGNKYGHPSIRTLQRFDDLGIRHINTMDVGDVVVRLRE